MPPRAGEVRTLAGVAAVLLGVAAVPVLLVVWSGAEAPAAPVHVAAPVTEAPASDGVLPGPPGSGAGPAGSGGVGSPSGSESPPGDATTGGDPSGVGPARLAAAPGVVRADPVWVQRVAAATGVDARALAAYATADLTVEREQPGCGLGWNTLAGIGAIESGHGRYGGAVLTAEGRPDPPIVGVPLDGGEGVASIPDTDGGRLDGDAVWDRAVGPLQFIPSTWVRWGADADGDGAADPHQVDDAALAAARYLCADHDLRTPASWRAAVLTYNRSAEYADDVAARANQYAAAARAGVG